MATRNKRSYNISEDDNSEAADTHTNNRRRQRKKRRMNVRQEEDLDDDTGNESDDNELKLTDIFTIFLASIRPPKLSTVTYNKHRECLSNFSTYLERYECSDELDDVDDGNVAEFLGYFLIRRCLASSSECKQCASTMRKLCCWLEKEKYVKKGALQEVKDICSIAAKDHANISKLMKKLEESQTGQGVNEAVGSMLSFEKKQELREMKERVNFIRNALVQPEALTHHRLIARLTEEMHALKTTALQKYGIEQNDLVCILID